ncbi:MAG: cytochrome b/b6 domain-containing protein [Prolixibacteraceae bacterium]|nr:cytochrome b/b6 domain-containing protein [Prolixibacteraceae bacterium]
MTQKTTSTETGTSILLQTNSAAVRIWHWLTFLVVTALIVTVLMASTVLEPKENIPVVQNILKDKGVVVSNDQTFAVTHMYDDKMWGLHEILGYALAFLFLSRIAVGLTQPKEERISFRLKKARMELKQTVSDRKEWKHYLIVKASYSLFYLLLFAMVTTGLTIAFGKDLGLTGPTRHTIKEVHGFIQYLIYAFLFFHLAGVIRAELRIAKGIVSGMINGGA